MKRHALGQQCRSNREGNIVLCGGGGDGVVNVASDWALKRDGAFILARPR